MFAYRENWTEDNIGIYQCNYYLKGLLSALTDECIVCALIEYKTAQSRLVLCFELFSLCPF